MKIDRSHPPLINDQSIFPSITQWNTFCDTINSSLQIYNVVITNHDKKILSRIVILPIVGFTIISIILIIFGRPYIGLGIFVATVVTSLTICWYDRNRVDRAYDRAIENLKSVVKKVNEEGWLVESCGVLLSLVLTGPTTSFKEDEGDGDEEKNDDSRETKRNNVTNVYIECKRISSSSHRHQGNDDELLAGGQKQPIDRTIVYNEEDESFSC
jgi:hypothetical protein